MIVLGVSNPTDEAWKGTVQYMVDGVEQQLECIGCEGDPFAGIITELVVDGNDNVGGTFRCVNGDSCSLTPVGTYFHLSFHFTYSKRRF